MLPNRYFSPRWAEPTTILPIMLLFLCGTAQAQTNPTLPELITKANALTDLSAVGPYELRARIVVEAGSEKEQQGEITIDRDWDRSRLELQLGDFQQVEVVSQGTRHVWRSRPYPVIGLETLEGIEDVLQLRTSFPALTKYSESYRRKVLGGRATCTDARPPFEKKLRFCFDTQTGALLEASDSEGWRGRFSEYAAAGSGMFPGTMELTLPRKPRHLEFLNITVDGRIFDDARFAPPLGALAFGVCNRMAAATATIGEGWAVAGMQPGEIYLYAIVEADGRVHDLKAYGNKYKWVQREVTKRAQRWSFSPAQCGATAVASEILVPLARVYSYDWGSGSSSSYEPSNNLSSFDYFRLPINPDQVQDQTPSK